MKKGISMSISLVVIIIIAVLVLATLLYLFFFQTGAEMSKAEANQIFYGNCQKYRGTNCDWAVTSDPDFPKFLKACKFLFGEERDAFSCLYSMCADCKEYRLDEIQCAGMCEICKGHQSSGVDTSTCCSEFRDKCSISCFVCNA